MESYFVGLDLSLNGTGLIILDNETKIINKKLITSNPKEDIEDRYIHILLELDFILSIHPLQKINVEGLSYQSVSSNAAQLAGLHFIVRTELKKKLINYKEKVEIIPPGVLKKFITGKGNCKKNLILLNVFKKFGETFDDDNLADAYSLARLALFEYNKKEDIQMDKVHKEDKKKKKETVLINDSFIQEVNISKENADSIMESKTNKKEIIHERV